MSFILQSRVALVDRTQQDAQLHNISRTANKKEQSTQSAAVTVHTYTHNPYHPVEMRDVECAYTSPSLAAIISDSTIPRIVYVNGRPMVLPTVAVQQDMSVQDISFENTASSEEEDEEEAEPEIEVLTVQFHQHRAVYFCDLEPSIGDFVVVRGDRGYDIGSVVSKASKMTYVQDPKKDEVTWVTAIATPEEIRQAQTEQVAYEDEALQSIRRAVAHFGLPMTVKSCEAQFDRKKLSFYFEAAGKVFFVQLLKLLHKEFGCRIWLHQINRHKNDGNDREQGCY